MTDSTAALCNDRYRTTNTTAVLAGTVNEPDGASKRADPRPCAAKQSAFSQLTLQFKTTRYTDELSVKTTVPEVTNTWLGVVSSSNVLVFVALL